MTEKNEKTLEEKANDFEEEIEGIGEKIGKGIEKRVKEEICSQSIFGVLYALLASLIGIILIGVSIIAIRVLNSHLEIAFLSNLGSFLSNNLGLFFVILLIFSYFSYLKKTLRSLHRVLSPIFASLAITVFFWIVASVLGMIRFSIGRFSFAYISNLIMNNLWNIFIFFMILLYLVVMVKMNSKIDKKPKKESEETVKDEDKSKDRNKDEIKRIYRSKKEKILGGVAGGMAEYLETDPVLLRLLWVVLVLLSGGFGLLIYIICWIIIPRNPEHEW